MRRCWHLLSIEVLSVNKVMTQDIVFQYEISVAFWIIGEADFNLVFPCRKQSIWTNGFFPMIFLSIWFYIFGTFFSSELGR